MSNSDRRRSPAERVDDIAGALEALRTAIREALLRHKQAGHPIAIWRDGAVEWIPPEDIQVSAHEDKE